MSGSVFQDLGIDVAEIFRYVLDWEGVCDSVILMESLLCGSVKCCKILN